MNRSKGVYEIKKKGVFRLFKKVINFNSGPAALPLEVLQKVQSELLDYKNTNMSILEISHRSQEFEIMIMEAEKNIMDIYCLSDDYQVLFLQGGASFQFAMIPYNFLPVHKVANYVITGIFAEKAWKEASRIGESHIAASSKENNFSFIPKSWDIKLSPAPAYLHLTTNNTIFGTQWHEIPSSFSVPLVADMSSDILSRPRNMTQFSLVYAGAQKNLMISGLTLVIIKKSFLEGAVKKLPAIMSYKVHADNRSLYSTPPCFSIYMLNEALKWIKDQGGLQAVGARNQEKASILYSVIDNSGGFYKGYAEKKDRSLMNVTFHLPSKDLERAFLEEAASLNMVGLQGHYLLGGIRASTYNAMSVEGCKTLSELMKDFIKRYG